MNKGIKYLAVAMLAGAVIASTYAANIQVIWSAAASTGIGLANGTPAPVGTLIEIGAFSGAANTALTGFNVFASSTIPATFSGAFWNQINSTADEALYATKQLYLVAQSGGEQGIFTYIGGTQWVYPHAADIPNQITPDVEDMVSNAGTALNALKAGGTIFQGNGLVFDAGNQVSYLTMAAPIPEPSSIALVAVGLLGMVGLIRRRS
jgi:hypothetical protein